MKGLENYLALYIISNAVAILLLLAAWKAPKIARVLFFLLFAWAGYTNYYYAIHYPNAYLDYADLSFIRGYKQFILGWFSQHIVVMVGFIATCQALIAISMLLKGWIFKSGCIGAMIFLLAIAPLGVGAAFPCTVIMTVALFILLKKYNHNFIWKRNRSLKIRSLTSPHFNR